MSRPRPPARLPAPAVVLAVVANVVNAGAVPVPVSQDRGQEQEPEYEPGAAGQAAARDRLVALLGDGPLRFSTVPDEPTAAGDFALRTRVVDGSGLEVAIDVVARGGDATVVLWRGERGAEERPLLVFSGGIAVAPAQAEPGYEPGVAVLTGARSTVSLSPSGIDFSSGLSGTAAWDPGEEEAAAGVLATGCSVTVSRSFEELEQLRRGAEFAVEPWPDGSGEAFVVWLSPDVRLLVEADPDRAFPLSRVIHQKRETEGSPEVASVIEVLATGAMTPPWEHLTAVSVARSDATVWTQSNLHRLRAVTPGIVDAMNPLQPQAPGERREVVELVSRYVWQVLGGGRALMTNPGSGDEAAPASPGDQGGLAAVLAASGWPPPAFAELAQRAEEPAVPEWDEPGDDERRLPARDVPVAFEVPGGSKSIPYRSVAGLPNVEVVIDDLEPLWLTLDTGAINSMLTAEVARQLPGGRSWSLTDRIVGIAGSAEYHTVEVSDVTVGGIPVVVGEFAVAELEQPSGNVLWVAPGDEGSGRLGRDVLGEVPFTLDPFEGTITLHNPDGFTPPDGAVRYPLVQQPIPGHSPAPVVQGAAVGAAESGLPLLLDTGFNLTLTIDESQLEAVFPGGQGRRWRIPASGVTGTLPMWCFRPEPGPDGAGPLQILGTTVPFPTLVFNGDVEPLQGLAVAGMGFLDHVVTTFDFAGGAVYVAPEPRGSDRDRDRDREPENLLAREPGIALSPEDDFERLRAAASSGDWSGFDFEPGGEVNQDRLGHLVQVAIDGGLPEAVPHLFASGYDPETALPHEHPALRAVVTGQPDIAAMIVRRSGSEVASGALVLAAREGLPDVCRALVEAGAVPGAEALAAALLNPESGVFEVISPSVTPEVLEAAVPSTVQISLTIGAAKADQQGVTWVHFATATGHRDALAWLIDRGADPSATDAAGKNPLDYAVETGNAETLQILLERGVTPVSSSRGLTGVMVRAAMLPSEVLITLAGHPEAAALLESDRAGQVLATAAAAGNSGVVSFLLERGVRADITVDGGSNPLGWATKRFHLSVCPGHLDDGALPDAGQASTYLEVIRLLSGAGAGPGVEPGETSGVSSFAHLASWGDATEAMARVSPDLGDRQGAALDRALRIASGHGNIVAQIWTLDAAAAAGHEFSTEALRAALDDAVGFGQTFAAARLAEVWSRTRPAAELGGFLHAAVEIADTATIGVLLEAGAATEGRNDDDETPLITAAKGDHSELVRTLLEAGADPAAKDWLGRTALEHARRREEPVAEIIDLLEHPDATRPHRN